jgi:hypothetical protein
MTIFKKGPRKLTRTTLVTGKKGQIVIQKTNRVFKRIRLANLASKREQQPLESPVQDISIMTLETQCTPASSMSSLTQESTRYKKHGVSFDDFIEGNKDWRSFGSITYEGMKENGYVDILLKKISIYKSTKTNKAKHKAVICSSEFPLSEVASGLLQTKMRVVVLILDGIAKDPCGGAAKRRDSAVQADTLLLR